ncbi:MAG: GAF domain-containing sensor histidine kinase [Ardenticatenales bacterium]|nr:GAF domain-containing sensor histidine kinase [Ardenticatenales bacterium]
MESPLYDTDLTPNEQRRLATLALDVSGALIKPQPLTTILQECAEALVRHLDAAFARIWTLDETGALLELQASAGCYTHLDGPHSKIAVGQFKIGLIAQERLPHLTNDVLHDPRVSDPAWAEREGMVAFAGYPLLVGEHLVGVVALFTRHPLTEMMRQALAFIANNLALGIDHKRAEEKLRVRNEVVETLNHLGQLLSAELDLQKLVQAVTDAATHLIGAQFGAFFYNVVNKQGESYTLYTLSGVPHAAFAHYPLPRNTDLFGPTFRGEGVIRLADVKKSPRYGNNAPYHGMPADHLPVASYLAVPVIARSGAVLGGLFFGHAQANVFTERHEQLVVGLAAQAAIAMDNAQIYQQAQSAVEQREQFLTVASHELKTPLTTIKGYIDLLLRRAARTGNVPESTLHSYQVLEREVGRLTRLMDMLLDLSRLHAGRLHLEQEPVDLAGLAHRVVTTLQPTLPKHELALEGADQVLLVYGDALRLEQVLQNLAGNAIKYSPEGGRIGISFERTSDRVQMAVSDQGVGIAPADIPHLFEEFYRGDERVTRGIAGLGIGLTVVQHLVEAHGGKIRVTSEVGKGSVFTVELPCLAG